MTFEEKKGPTGSERALDKLMKYERGSDNYPDCKIWAVKRYFGRAQHGGAPGPLGFQLRKDFKNDLGIEETEILWLVARVEKGGWWPRWREALGVLDEFPGEKNRLGFTLSKENPSIYDDMTRVFYRGELLVHVTDYLTHRFRIEDIIALVKAHPKLVRNHQEYDNPEVGLPKDLAWRIDPWE